MGGKTAFLRLICGATALTVNAAIAATTAFADYNLVVGKDLTSSSTVEGRTVVGGKLKGGASNYGTRLTPSSLFGDIDTLIVGSTIAAGNVNIAAGSVRMKGTKEKGSNVNLNGHGGQLFQNDSGVQARVDEAILGMSNFSLWLGGLSATGTIFNPAGPSAVRFNAVAGPDNIVVFDVDGSIFKDSNSQQYELVLGAGVNATTTFVFNVTGSSIHFNQGNFVGLFTQSAIRPYLVWNFEEAANIKLDRQWFGSIVAPKANLTNSAAIEGSVWTGGNFTQNGEVHFPAYRGELPADPAPEPATFALTALAALGVLAIRGRSRPPRP